MRGIKPQVIHFCGDKPWEDEEEWEGTRQWRNAAEEMVRICPMMSGLLGSRSRPNS